MCQVGTAADGNLSTQEAEKGGYTRLDYSLYRGKLCLSRKEKKRKNKIKKIVRVMLLQLTWEEMVLMTNF